MLHATRAAMSFSGKRFGLRQLQALMRKLRASQLEDLRPARADHADLMKRGYAGGSTCHAVYMTMRAAKAIDFDLRRVKKKDVTMSGSRGAMRQLLKDMAWSQCSPKLVSLAIPEWQAMKEHATLAVLSAQRSCGPQVSFDDLRAKARSLGHSKLDRLTRSDLQALICNGRAEASKRPTLEVLRKRVRDDGGDPQPSSSDGGRVSWTRAECEDFLAKRARR